MIDEGPGEHDAHLMDDDGDEDTVPCPACGQPVYAQAIRCPHCGAWYNGPAWKCKPMQHPDIPDLRGKAWWWWVAVGLLVLFGLFILKFGQPF